MGKIRIAGPPVPVKQAIEVQSDPTRGQTIIQKFESAGKNLNGLAQTFQDLRIPYELLVSPIKSTLTTNATGSQLGIPEKICDTWQILANELQMDLREHPDALLLEDVEPGALGQVMDAVDKYNQHKDYTLPFNPIADDLFDLLIRGTTHFAVSQYVLKHTTIAPNDYSANIADSNVNKLYTSDQLLAEVTDPGLWTFPLPGRLIYKLQMIPPADPHAKYLWSWRKLASTETTNATTRVEISTEYWLYSWSTVLYKLVT